MFAGRLQGRHAAAERLQLVAAASTTDHMYTTHASTRPCAALRRPAAHSRGRSGAVGARHCHVGAQRTTTGLLAILAAAALVLVLRMRSDAAPLQLSNSSLGLSPHAPWLAALSQDGPGTCYDIVQQRWRPEGSAGDRGASGAGWPPPQLQRRAVVTFVFTWLHAENGKRAEQLAPAWSRAGVAAGAAGEAPGGPWPTPPHWQCMHQAFLPTA